MFRDEGATSLESWTAESFGVSGPTARSYAQVAEKSEDLPHLMGALLRGEISFDKVRTVLDVATPETDQELCDQAKELNVRELAEVARTHRRPGPVRFGLPSRSEHDRRYLRFNDEHRTMSAPVARRVLCPDQGLCRCLCGQASPPTGETPLGPAAL